MNCRAIKSVMRNRKNFEKNSRKSKLILERTLSIVPAQNSNESDGRLNLLNNYFPLPICNYFSLIFFSKLNINRSVIFYF